MEPAVLWKCGTLIFITNQSHAAWAKAEFARSGETSLATRRQRRTSAALRASSPLWRRTSSGAPGSCRTGESSFRLALPCPTYKTWDGSIGLGALM